MFILKMTKFELFIRLFVFFIGIFILSLGIATIIEANLGVSSWDVLHIGLFKTFGFTIGTWSQIVGLIVIFITILFDKKIISIGTVLNMIFIGFFIDFFLFLIPQITHFVFQYLFLFIGLIIMGIGSGLYITAGLGPGPRDSLMLALSKRYKWSIRNVKTTMEILVVLIGWFLGGPVFIGTLIAAVLIGPIMHFSINWWDKKLTPLFVNVKKISLSEKSNQTKKEEIL